MGRMLYLECASGISGDMAVAALLDLGASEEKLQKALASLPVGGFETRVSRVRKAGLDACDFNVVLDTAYENHDHDMAYLHGGNDEVARMLEEGAGCKHVHGCGHHHGHGHNVACDHGHAHDHHDEGDHNHAHEHAHAHDHHHEHDAHGHHHHHHHHEHRGMPEIEAVIRAADITDRAKDMALRIFGIIARAEAKAHGVSIDQVHFHEVGAVDSIVDVVAFAVCFDDLGIDDVVVERLCEGRGTVRCQHGVPPVPVPAVSNIVSEAGLPLSIMDAQGEFVTPTGAAIAAAVCTRPKLPERFTVERIGLGAGKREYAVPSLLRAMIVEEATDETGSCADPARESHIWKLECDVDDCTGEALGFVMERLFAVGAREAHFVPIFMKKNRPAYQIQIICMQDDIPAMEAELFAHTTTIGIRRTAMERTVLSREELCASTPYGEVRAKKVTLPDGRTRITPEHDSVEAVVAASCARAIAASSSGAQVLDTGIQALNDGAKAPDIEDVCEGAIGPNRGLIYQEAYQFVMRAFD